jgi:hypothetical protein
MACAAQYYPLLLMLNIVTNHAKRAHGARFLELYPTSKACTPGQRLLQLGISDSPRNLQLPEYTIDVSDHARFEREPIDIHVPLPTVGTDISLQLTFD